MTDVRLRLAPWIPAIRSAAIAAGIPPATLGAVVYTESRGNAFALRVERGFWSRYRSGIWRAIRGNKYAADDRWLDFPDLVAASYGLCQVMLPVAVEHGLKLAYPTELLHPETNLALGARILREHLDRSGGNEREALLRYNGGGDIHYPTRVLAAKQQIDQPEVWA